MKRVIVLETRNPRTKEEKKLFGRTNVKKCTDITDIFLNQKQTDEQMVDTLIHELLHFVCSITTFKPKISLKVEEARVRAATTAAIKVLLNDK
jgi:Zn-dependent peptidase ImmA (M78 family)